VTHLPAYLRGLMLAGFAAAYMSTMATHINLGASYMINDFYRRFVKKDGSEGHYVTASRVATVAVTILAAVASLYMQSIEGAWKFLMSIGAGAGLVFMLRWFWWRVNAWSEIGAMSAAGACSLFLQSSAAAGVVSALQRIDPKLSMPVGHGLDSADPHGFAWLMILTTSFTTLSWLVVTFVTKPEPEEKLRSFYNLVRPPVAGWGYIANVATDAPAQSLLVNTLHWLTGTAMLYCALFGVGKVIFGSMALGLGLLLAGALCFWFLFWDLNRRGWESLT
jgi:solute:Na+ symporter, SSS family